ncbi:hypothetical protein [Sphingomonas montanisoli]|uniref:Uncharacterized protein n=1 Tax=Sphingomonas montanisoli TaxID=2606412 RepID=A0A5D9C6H6_9SPHN|nr:hypothetical protein [Sphingomonas montanisoli]TZG25595.1 hypothetical protein FYJ91_11250 [Sphingomonas montanisoli]
MSIAYRPPSTRIMPPPPAEFADEFVKGGHRRVERLYGARSDLLNKWIEISGGKDLYARRAAHMRETGKGGPCRNLSR